MTRYTPVYAKAVDRRFRMYRSARVIGLVLIPFVLALVACVLAGCEGRDNFKDVKNVQNTKPDYEVNVENMDKHPNIGFLCFKGIPILTTTRDYNAVTIVPATATDAWAFCKGQEK